MALKGNKLEGALVSMAGTLVYLHEMAAVLAKKPVVPQSVAAMMVDTQRELDTLGKQLAASNAAVGKEAQPLLDEWLRLRGLSVGGCFSGRTTRSAGKSLTITGGVAHAQLYPRMIGGVRVVVVRLVGGQIGLPDGQVVRTVSEIPVQDQDSYYLRALRDIKAKVAEPDVTSLVLHVLVPIQEVQRMNWAHEGVLELA